ncbi:MAG: hypothetical protein U5N26_07070 [Candidatus Marinimicrobia bacterium]|nr:hypothetical protein [Candidatus Neomarinimicrobiota bacterium]
MRTSKKNAFSGMTSIFIGLTSLLLMLSLVLVSCDILPIDDIVPIVDEYEPNNERSEAFAIEQDTIYNAHIAENDADFFSFTTTHGSTTFDEVEISVFDVGLDLMIGVAIYNSDGEFIEKNSASTGGATLTYVLRNLHSDETYYARFSGTWGGGYQVDGAGDHNSEGAYSFKIMNLNANDEFAGNHSLNDAHPIITDQTYNGVLVSKWETDYFAFTPTAENMQLQVTNVSSDLIIGIALYRSNFELIGTAGPSTVGANYTLNLNNLNTEATYYLRFSGTWGGSYQVDGAGDHIGYGSYTFVLVDK